MSKKEGMANKAIKKEEKIAYESNIWKFYLASFFGNLEFTAPIFVLFLLSNNVTMTQVFLLQSLFTVVIFFMEVPSGVIADLWGRKHALALSYLFASVGYIVYASSSSFLFFIIAEILIAICWALYSGADSALVYDTLKTIKKEKSFKQIMGNTASMVLFAIGIAALFGGYLGELLGYRPVFFIGATFLFLGFLLCLLIREPKHYKESEDRYFLKHLKEGIRFSYQHKEVWKYIQYYSLISAFGWLFIFLIPPYFLEEGYSITSIGLITGIYFLFQALGYKFTAKISKNISDDKALIFILFFIACSFCSLFFATSQAVIIIAFAMAFCLAVKDIMSDNAVHEHISSSHRATILSVKNMGKNVMFAVFGPLLGYVSEIYDIKTTFLCMGILLLLFGIWMLILFYQTKKNKEIKIHKKKN